jgi:hypothetical protein
MNIRRRWNNHKCRLLAGTHPNRHLQNVAIKYGVASLVFETIIFCDSEHLSMYEILAEKAFSPELNIGACGDNPAKGRKFSDIHKARLSASLKGRTITESAKQKLRETVKRNGPTDLQIAEFSTRKGCPATPGSALGLAKGRTGRKCSESQLAALKLGPRARWQPTIY